MPEPSKRQDCLTNSVKWTKMNKAMERLDEKRRRKGKKVVESGGFWILGDDARPLPKGTNQFCCELILNNGTHMGKVVRNPRSCNKWQKWVSKKY